MATMRKRKFPEIILVNEEKHLRSKVKFQI